MVLLYRRTSIFESSAQTLVNTVNCVGVMGKGIAKEFKDREPEMFAQYKILCDRGELRPGLLWLWRGQRNWVLNFPTKIHWRNPSRLEWIELGLQKFVANFKNQEIREISFPRLGCGNGGLDWRDVQPLMEKYLVELPISIFIHDYEKDIGIPEHLEAVSRELQRVHDHSDSFEVFREMLASAIKITEGRFVILDNGQPIKAEMDANGDLVLHSGGKTSHFGEEELWGVWVALQKGLVTQDRAEWSGGFGGKQLFSILCLLPNIRPVEVQRPNAPPELAIEWKDGQRVSVTSGAAESEQLDLSWR